MDASFSASGFPLVFHFPRFRDSSKAGNDRRSSGFFVSVKRREVVTGFACQVVTVTSSGAAVPIGRNRAG